jgi:hypothetical protein
MKFHPIVTLRPKAKGLLENMSEEERDRLKFDVEIRREGLQGFTPVAECEHGEFFPRATYEEVARTMREVRENE